MKLLQNPFPGLRPYQSKEHELFFGRSNHVSEILRKLQTFRFVSIVGNSGCGKSSLIRAGVLPDFDGKPDWNVIRIQPGQHANKALATSIANSYNLDKTEALNTILKGPLGLVQLIRPIAPKGHKVLLLVDQFEELFRFEETAPTQNQTHFVRSLLEAADQKDISFYVIITIRSDFLGDCEKFLGLPEAINDGQFLVPRMNDEEMQECITGPIQFAGGKISPRLVQRLIQEVGNKPDQLPVLQHALMQSWNVWIKDQTPEQPIDIEHYESIGTVKSALSRHAEQVYISLDQKQQKIAKRLFQTITVQTADNRGIRRPTSLALIAQIAACSEKELMVVLDKFRSTENGFIMPSKHLALSSDSVIDISHESLMRIWVRLKSWVEEEAKSASLYRRICENATLYEQGQSSLWRDPDLQIALNWLNTEKPNKYWASPYNTHFELAIKFINSSKEEQAFTSLTKKRAIRLRNVAVLFTLIILAALSSWALVEQSNANKSAEAAVKDQKIAEEQTQLAQVNLDKSIRQEQLAKEHQKDAESQRIIAESKALEAHESSLLAQAASQSSEAARLEAVAQRSYAEQQTQLAEAHQIKAEQAAQQAMQLAMQALAQNLAIRSKFTEDDVQLKSLLALHAYRIHKMFGGTGIDKQIYESVFQALRSIQPPHEIGHRNHKAAVQSLCFLPNGQLISAGSDGIIHSFGPLGSSNSNGMAETPLTKICNMGSDVVVSDRNLNLLVFKGSDLNSIPKQWTSGHSAQIIGLHYINNRIYSVSADGTTRVWSKTGEIMEVIPMDITPTASTLSAEGELIVGGSEGQVYSLSGEAKSFHAVGRFVAEQITAVGKSQNHLAIGTVTGSFLLVDDQLKKINMLEHPSQISAVQFLPGDSTIASSSLDGNVRIFRIDKTLYEPIVFNEHQSWVMDMAVDSERKVMASCGKDDRMVQLYTIDDSVMVKKLKGKITRELTKEEWNIYIGEGIETTNILK